MLAVPDVEVGSVVPFHKPWPVPCGCLRRFPVDSTRMPRGQESAHRKDFPAQNAQLYSAFTTNQTRHWHSLPSTSRNFIRPYFSHFPGFCSSIRQNALKTVVLPASSFPVDFRTLLKGARRLLTPNSFKCKRRKQLTAAQIKIQALSCLQGLSCSCCGGHSDTPRS